MTSLLTQAQLDSSSLRVRPFGPTSTKQYVLVPVTPSLQLGGDFTLECWVKVPTITAQQEYLIETYTGSGSGGYVLRLNNGNIMAYAMGGGAQPSAVSTNTISLNQWYHVAATFNDATDEVRFYINGVYDGNATLNVDNNTSSTELRIGARGDDANVNDIVHMDEIRIWNVVRTDNEIASSMSTCLTGNEAGLVLYYDFEDLGMSGITADKSMYGNDGAVIGNIDPKIDGAFSCCFVDNQISVNANILSVNEIGANYQWINCVGNTAIAGATNQTFTPSYNGSFACVIDNGACSDTSACIAITTVGINELETNQISLYPNPASNSLSISAQEPIESVLIFDLTGALVQSEPNGNFTVASLKNGIYLVNVQTTKGYFVARFVKE
ncbi:MAG: hypothetical protein A3D92_20900 [Bacteroidetes bacterium RIFCSPHIGHO2_02_FULL_44_7]|nr:MAG: hypothetical protein A3D92_20900 [Bacteroidetes bacterium RIFCSPHIGHO2_02_FULL_44_7]